MLMTCFEAKFSIARPSQLKLNLNGSLLIGSHFVLPKVKCESGKINSGFSRSVDLQSTIESHQR